MRSAHDCGRPLARVYRCVTAWRAHARPHTTPRVVVLALAGSMMVAACTDTATAPANNPANAPGGDPVRLLESTRGVVHGVTYPVVAIQPSKVTLGTGKKVSLLTQLTAGNGAKWTGRFVKWSSSDPSVAAVSSTAWGASSGDAAVITGNKYGTATITATTLSATSGTITVTVSGTGDPPPPPPPPLGGTHEPDGMTTVLNTGSITTGPSSPAGSNGISWNSGGPVPLNVTVIQGPTGTIQLSSTASDEPQASGWRVTFPAGRLNDPAMALGLPFSTHGTGMYYMRYRLRLGSTWSARAMNSGDCKLFAPKDDGGSDDIVMAYGDPGNGIAIPGYGAGVLLQGPQTTNVPDWNHSVIPAADVFQAGVWNTFEVLYTPDSSPGAGDGAVTIWVNGVQGVSRTGLMLFGSGRRMGWNDLQMYFARSVYGGVQSATTFADVDQIYASVK